MTTPSDSPRLPATLSWLPALKQPQLVLDWSLAQWDRAIRLARRERLLARLAAAIDGAGVLGDLPLPVRHHLAGALQLARSRTRALTWAVERLPDLLDQPNYPLVLLKGAAYIAQGLPIAAGRLPSDLDILIPAEHLEHARFLLHQTGWFEPPMDEADRRYYLEWSHELPPLRHPGFGIELDVHHNILAPRNGRMPEVQRLLARLRPSGVGPWCVLGDVDQVLHSAAHLVRDSEPLHRVRDLVDIDGLVAHFSADPGFGTRLAERALELDLAGELGLALTLAHAWLGTPLPLARPGQHHTLKEAAFRRLLTPEEPALPPSRAARLAGLYILADYHRTRLPVSVLLPHLWRKWRLRHAPDDPAPADPVNAP